MAYYRKKPVTIQAVRFLNQGNDWHRMFNEVPPWLSEAKAIGRLSTVLGKNEGLVIKTLNGPVFVALGEWIVLGIEGELYPCQDKIFRNTYDFISFKKPEELEEEED